MKLSKKPIILVRLIGGLGNQLFSYATALRVALKNNAELVVDDITGFTGDDQYQRQYQLDHFSISSRKATANERLEPFAKLKRYLKRLVNNLRKNNLTYIQDFENSFKPEMLELKLKKNLYMEGYWQDERYFKDIENIVRQELKIKPPEDELNLSIAKEIKKNTSIAIHVRFFYDASSGKDISSNYYKKAILEIEKRLPGSHFYLFSDKPQEATNIINLPRDRLTVVDHNYGDDNCYADLWLMTLCDHFIVANSTFSWWGAWLSQNTKKIVLAPDFAIHDGGSPAEQFNRIILDEWEKL